MARLIGRVNGQTPHDSGYDGDNCIYPLNIEMIWLVSDDSAIDS